MRRDYVQCCDVHSKFAGFGEFTEASTQRKKVVAGYAGGEVGEGKGKVVYP